MRTEIIAFDNIEIENHKFYNKRNPLLMDDVDIDKIIASNKVSFKKGYKYFIGYKDGEEVIPLCIRVPQINSNARILEGTECMSFLIPADELLEKYNKIWNKVSNNIKKRF